MAYTTNHKGDKATSHILINSAKPVGFQVPEGQTARTFANLYDLVDYYNVFLQFPYATDLPFERYELEFLLFFNYSF